MIGHRLAALKRQYDEINEGIETIERAVAARGDDEQATPEEQTQLDTLMQRADELRPEVESEAAKHKSMTATADVLKSIGLVGAGAGIQRAAKPDPKELTDDMTAGTYLSLLFRAMEQGDAEAQQLLRAVNPMAFGQINRVVADQLTTDNAGILPTPIVGNLLNFIDTARPVFDSFATQTMPEKGKTFSRPRITQHVTVAEQLTEKTQPASQKMTIVGENVTKRSIAGVLDISQQDIDWTEPAMLDVVLRDFIDTYAIWSEAEASTFLVAKAANTTVWTGTSLATMVASVTTGITALYGTAKAMPDVMWISLDVAMALASTMNTDNSMTAIDVLNRALAAVGINLTFIVGPQLAANTRILGVRRYVEQYERRKGLLQAINVQLLGWDVGYLVYLAFYGRVEALRKLV